MPWGVGNWLAGCTISCWFVGRGDGSKKDEQNVLIGVHPAYLWAGEEVDVCTTECWMEDEGMVVVGRGETAQIGLDL